MTTRAREHNLFLEEIQPYIDDYNPSQEVTAYAGQVSALAVIGPAGVGKSTLMEASGIQISTGITSRLPRDGETKFRHYYDFTDPRERSQVRNALRQGDFIQAISHPATKELYASEPQDFPDAHCNLWDPTAQEYRRVQELGIFASLRGICVVAPNYETWQSQWLGRTNSDRPDDYNGRMLEAYRSLTTMLEEPNIAFLINTDVDEGARALQLFAEGNHEQSTEQSAAGRYAAHQLLAGIVASNALRFS